MGHFDPNAYGLSVDNFVYTNAHGDYYDCYGNFFAGSFSWLQMWTYDPGIATVGSGGRLNGIGVGNTNVEGQYDTVDYYTDGMDCYRSYGSASDQAPVNVQCSTPIGEITSPVGWDSGDPTIYKWEQTLSPSATNFAGRTVTEQNPGGGGPDTCYFTGSSFAPFTAITGGTWTVGSGNHWGYDYVGWRSSAVTYYRAQGRAPCGTTFSQTMVINCSTAPLTYATNTLGCDINSTTVTSNRAGSLAIRTWP